MLKRVQNALLTTAVLLLASACASTEPAGSTIEPVPTATQESNPVDSAQPTPATRSEPIIRADPEPVAADDAWINIATVGGLDSIAVEHIQNTLALHDIPVGIGGSVMYGVQVPASKAELAAQLLRNDPLARAHVHWQPPRPASESPVELLEAPRAYAELLEEHPAGTSLGGVLRHDYVAEKVEFAPRVTSIQRTTLPYRAVDGSFQDGFAFKIVMKQADGSAAALVDANFQVWADGAQVTFQGGSAAGAAAGVTAD